MSTGNLLSALPFGTDPFDFTIITDVNGVVVLSFDNAGGSATYTDRVVFVLPDGSLVVSAALNVPHEAP